MQLPEPASARRGRLAGMEEVVGAALDPELEPEARVERLGHAFDHLVPAGDDGGDAPALGGQLLAGREVDACDLEERDVVEACIHTRARGIDEPRHDRRPQDRLIRRHRARQADRVGIRILGDEAPRVGLGQPGSDEDVLDRASESLLLRQPALHVATQRKRVRDAVEQRPCDLLDEVDLAGDVARAPRWHGQLPLPEISKPKPWSAFSCSSGGDLDADDLRRRRPGGARTTGRSGSAGVHVDAPGHPRAGEVDEHPTREQRSLLGEVRVDALLPAVRASRAEAEALGGAEDPERLEVRGLEQHLGRRVARPRCPRRP